MAVLSTSKTCYNLFTKRHWNSRHVPLIRSVLINPSCSLIPTHIIQWFISTGRDNLDFLRQLQLSLIKLKEEMQIWSWTNCSGRDEGDRMVWRTFWKEDRGNSRGISSSSQRNCPSAGTDCAPLLSPCLEPECSCWHLHLQWGFEMTCAHSAWCKTSS